MLAQAVTLQRILNSSRIQFLSFFSFHDVHAIELFFDAMQTIKKSWIYRQTEPLPYESVSFNQMSVPLNKDTLLWEVNRDGTSSVMLLQTLCFLDRWTGFHFENFNKQLYSQREQENVKPELKQGFPTRSMSVCEWTAGSISNCFYIWWRMVNCLCDTTSSSNISVSAG